MTSDELIEKLGENADRVSVLLLIKKLYKQRGMHPMRFVLFRMFRPVTVLYLLCKDAYYSLKHKLLH